MVGDDSAASNRRWDIGLCGPIRKLGARSPAENHRRETCLAVRLSAPARAAFPPSTRGVVRKTVSSGPWYRCKQKETVIMC